MAITELILYLEPTKGSTLHTQVQDFFSASASQPFAGNEATRYPAHITMVGFFNQPQPPTHTTITKALVDYIDRWNAQLHTDAAAAADSQKQEGEQVMRGTRTVIEGYIRPAEDTLLVAIRPSSELVGLIRRLSVQFPDLGLRPKKINHLSLCYWDDAYSAPAVPRVGSVGEDEGKDGEEVSEFEVVRKEKQAERVGWIELAITLAKGTIPMLSVDTSAKEGTTVEAMGKIENESWDVVMYAIEGRDKANGLPYPLQEVKRWTLPPYI
ncbi:hypothetical protein BGX33_012357 [Mortierella sp. NVP41]|nr:hypothetical protein BGX33_012357 [Mortierella sp. NVP41]